MRAKSATRSAAHRVAPLARAAAAVGTDGLLVEVHDDPTMALSDGQQAVSPEEFRALSAACRAIRSTLDCESPPELNPVPSDSGVWKD